MEAAARTSSVVADLPVSTARPRCSCDAGTLRAAQKAGTEGNRGRDRIRGRNRFRGRVSARCPGMVTSGLFMNERVAGEMTHVKGKTSRLEGDP